MFAKLSKKFPDSWPRSEQAVWGPIAWDRSTQIRLSLKRSLISGLSSNSRLRIPCISKFRTRTPAKMTLVQRHCPQSTTQSRERTTTKATTASSQVISNSLFPNQPTARNVGKYTKRDKQFLPSGFPTKILYSLLISYVSRLARPPWFDGPYTEEWHKLCKPAAF
jgi:hypothetical protein